MCGEQVTEKYLIYKDLPICEKDFRRVGHVCSVCDEPILDRVCMVDGVVMCEKDYSELIATWPCAACGKEIPTGKDRHIGQFQSCMGDSSKILTFCCCPVGIKKKFEFCQNISTLPGPHTLRK